MFITNPQDIEKYHACHRVWQGIPGIAVTDKGRIFVSFYSGNIKETYGNFAMVIKSRTKGRKFPLLRSGVVD